jgi:hypothetical protein
MTALTWDQVGERLYETGVDHGVLYIPTDGVYDVGVAWNGLVTVTESPSGAELTPTYADNIKYITLVSVEEFGGTIEAYTYPDEFMQCDGSAEPEPGVNIGQQNRAVFGLCYRSLLGNDTDGQDHGYKLHLVYGALASPSEKPYSTVNDSPEAITFSWEFSTTPVPVTGYKPSATIVLDSTKVDAGALAALEDILYGSVGVDPRLPLPDEIISLAPGTFTTVDLGIPANQPTYVSGTHVVTLPSVTGVQWKINGVNKTPGAQPALTVGQVAHVTAHALSGYVLVGDDDWVFNY